MGAKTNQKAIKKQKQKGMRFEHRFLIDVGGFWGPSWEAKWNQNRSKKASKNDEKKKGNKMAKKSQQEALSLRGAVGPGPWGGPPL